MYYEIGITVDRICEMKVIGFGETIVSEQLHDITDSLQTFEQTDLEHLLFQLTTNQNKKTLDFFTLQQITNFITETKNEFPIFTKLFKIQILMNPEDHG